MCQHVKSLQRLIFYLSCHIVFKKSSLRVCSSMRWSFETDNVWELKCLLFISSSFWDLCSVHQDPGNLSITSGVPLENISTAVTGGASVDVFVKFCHLYVTVRSLESCRWVCAPIKLFKKNVLGVIPKKNPLCPQKVLSMDVLKKWNHSSPTDITDNWHDVHKLV